MERALRDYNTALWKFHRKADGRYALHFIIGFAPSEARCLDPRKVLDLAGYMKKYVPETELGKPIVFFGRNEGSGKFAETEL